MAAQIHHRAAAGFIDFKPEWFEPAGKGTVVVIANVKIIYPAEEPFIDRGFGVLNEGIG